MYTLFTIVIISGNSQCMLSGVMYISIDNTPTQYLLTVDKQDRICKVKEMLSQMIQTTNNIVMAEILDHHVARIVVRKNKETMIRMENSTTIFSNKDLTKKRQKYINNKNCN